MSWSRRFDHPIALPDGRKLLTLRDAGQFITGLPKAKQQAEHWQTAAETLLTSAEHGGILMLAEIAMRQALNHGRPATPPAPRQKSVKAYRVIR